MLSGKLRTLRFSAIRQFIWRTCRYCDGIGGVEWGSLLLFVGSILVLTAAYQKKRRLDKQAFLAIGNFLAGAVFLLLAVFLWIVFTTGEKLQRRMSQKRRHMLDL